MIAITYGRCGCVGDVDRGGGIGIPRLHGFPRRYEMVDSVEIELQSPPMSLEIDTVRWMGRISLEVTY